MAKKLNYTHNLNILILDENNIIIEDKKLLESIYNEFDNKILTKRGKMLNRNFEIILYWKRLPLTDVQSKFMGELFISSQYSDKVLHETTNIFINEIENKLKINTLNKNWKIIFNISKLLETSNNVLTIN
jgi:hypothetical protein